MNTQEYIDIRMKELAMNIDDFEINQEILDCYDGICKISNKTINSIEVSFKKTTENGIDCKQWFDMSRFNKRFKAIEII